MSKPGKLRCAVYTRKSTEEGLEQAFNSLHAQRDACEAYIKSQAGEGWTLIRTAYDDGGFSGGSMDRPALKALMADIEAAKIDVVVVYKVDRLTRSLTDFSRIVETFDRKGVSFVSVTQAFNTTTSMGRLTLNVLLSFAQFEREVTGERIRDKIAASKAKGMWMGGFPSLGYDIAERRLVINPVEAETVRTIFTRYLQLGSVHVLKAELHRVGVISKAWTTRAGRAMGGQPFTRGSLFHLLQSRLYLGEIVHKGQIHPGEHAAIIERALFDAVQSKMREAAGEWGCRGRTKHGSLLTGLLFDQDGTPMSPSTAYGRHGKAFRYYVSVGFHRETSAPRDEAIRRVSAPQLESLIADRVGRLVGSAADLDLGDHLTRIELRSHAVHLLLKARPFLNGYGSNRLALESLALKISADDQLTIEPGGTLRLVISMRPVFRGGRSWLVNGTGTIASARPEGSAQLLSNLRKAHAWLRVHNLEPWSKVETHIEATSPDGSYIRQVMQLAFLAPAIQAAIVEGRQPPGMSLTAMLAKGVPLAWADQKRRYGIA